MYLSNFEAAEDVYREMDRLDLALQMRVQMGHWFEIERLLVELGSLKCTQNPRLVQKEERGNLSLLCKFFDSPLPVQAIDKVLSTRTTRVSLFKRLPCTF